MEVGYRTPLLDFFRRGEVARDVRLLAAQGALAPRAHEQLGLLMLLVGDPDSEVARVADATLAGLPRAPLAAFLARSDVGAEMRSFFAARGVEPADMPSADADAPIVEADAPTPAAAVVDPSAVQKIAAMNVAERLGLAMKGT